MRQNIYDNDTFFNEYKKMRREERKGTSANDLIDIPTIRSMLPKLDGLRVLDLGCGYGDNCKYFKEHGASYVLGIDLSSNMISVASEENKEEGIEYQVMAMEDISTINKKFDLVVSSLAVHYVKDFNKLCGDVYNLLDDGGYFIYSSEHPLNTAPILNEECHGKNRIDIGGKRYYLLSDYNRCGKRFKNWNYCDVEKYHRNFSEVINTLVKNKFKIEELLEPTPTDEMIEKVDKFKYQFDRPYFLFVKVKK